MFPTKEQCEDDAVVLLQHLIKESHKLVCQSSTLASKYHFSCHDITREGKSISEDKIVTIQKNP